MGKSKGYHSRKGKTAYQLLHKVVNLSQCNEESTTHNQCDPNYSFPLAWSLSLVLFGTPKRFTTMCSIWFQSFSSKTNIPEFQFILHTVDDITPEQMPTDKNRFPYITKQMFNPHQQVKFYKQKELYSNPSSLAFLATHTHMPYPLEMLCFVRVFDII